MLLLYLRWAFFSYCLMGQLAHSYVILKRDKTEYGVEGEALRRFQNFKKVYVDNIQEIEIKYHDLASSGNQDAVFIIGDNETYLVKMNSTQSALDSVANLDSTDIVAASRHHFRKPWKGGTKESDEQSSQDTDSYWFEFKYDNITQESYPGFIPISACQSQELGGDGSVAFAYLFGKAANGGKSLEVEYAVSIFTLSLTLGVSPSESYSLTGTTTCNIKAGTVGQILLKPNFITTCPKGRRARWSRKLRKFLTDTEFKRYSKMHFLVKESSYQLECATSDVVDLFCEGHKLGETDWDEPLGVDYEQKLLQAQKN